MARIASLLIATALLAGCSALPENRSERRGASTASTPSRALPAPKSGADAQCLSSLGQLGAQYTPVADRYLDNGCQILGSVQLASLPADHSTLAVTNLGPVTCEVSQAFAGWARYGVDRAARQMLGSGLRSIETFGSFSCRDVAGTGRRSAHAQAGAIDVSGFVLEDGRRIVIKEAWHSANAQERAFLRAVQGSACRRFGTVLGPDYNAAHADHFHLEGVIQGKSYCR
jgi:hypothetical protein